MNSRQRFTAQIPRNSPSKQGRHVRNANHSLAKNCEAPENDTTQAEESCEEASSMQFEAFSEELENVQNSLVENYFSRGKTKPKGNGQQRRRTVNTIDEDNSDIENTKPRMNIECNLENLREWFEVVDSYLPDNVKTQNKNLKNEFPKWMNYLLAGFNVMLYGVGSKRRLLDDFCKEILCDYSYIVVDGFQPSVNARTILQSLESRFALKTHKKCRSIVEWASLLSDSLFKHNQDVVLVLNNIDGIGLREKIQQQALAELAKGRNIFIIASIDHVNATLLWNQPMLNAFRFIWVNADTMLTYSVELLASDSKLLGLSAKTAGTTHSVTSIDVVWQSLTTNSRMILYKLAKLFYSTRQPIEFFQLFRCVRDDFLVSSDIALRQQLIEFHDHRLINKERLQDGNEYIRMTVDEKVMRAFLQEKNMLLSDEE
ncbi:hypothetical protein AB6A40_003090 [Gnathostoma spinigerum]|uniref:Origin recognition complex subunit 2 n=1 Tax=Gnathostoma spinigerum TaxID=75299 RepID=A0ABD6EB09_9BILA